MKDNIDKLLKNVENNYKNFRNAELAKSKGDIFNDAHKIEFMGSMKEYLTVGMPMDDSFAGSLSKDGDKLLDNLYGFFVKDWGGPAIADYEDAYVLATDYLDAKYAAGEYRFYRPKNENSM